MMAFLVTAKLTGSMMIPSANANPTRPMPPASSRLMHSFGLSVRRARECGADWEAGTPGRLRRAFSASGPFAWPVVALERSDA
jgi:hypothetical protein